MEVFEFLQTTSNQRPTPCAIDDRVENLETATWYDHKH